MRNAASKLMWVGRATVFMMGLAVMLALVLGVATTALGATGASFILGKPNSAETPTSLVSTLSKATQSALSVTNKSGGPALSLGVLSGKAPIKVSERLALQPTSVLTSWTARTQPSFWARPRRLLMPPTLITPTTPPLRRAQRALIVRGTPTPSTARTRPSSWA